MIYLQYHRRISVNLYKNNQQNFVWYTSKEANVLTDSTEQEVKRLKLAKEVSGKWITSVIGVLETWDVVKRYQLLEPAGRACAHGPNATVDLARQLCQDIKDVNERLERYQKGFSTPDHFWSWDVEENRLRSLTFEYRSAVAPCACPLVRTGTIALNGALCECSYGWVKEHFEALLDQEVQVTIESTVARGGDSCKFTIHPK
jgi:hypothetical protein